ncbi:MAG: outer membrane beta-barrel protein [Myxococcaceae bacterium]|nr:outer membrane beta-barrel protein [Myxococcaceae bacterium]
MKRLISVVLGLFASAAFAQVQPFHANLGLSTQVFSARGYDLVDLDDHFHSFRFAAGTTFELRAWRLDLEAGVTTGGNDATSHVQLATGLGLVGLDLSATARFPVTAWFHPYVRVGVGYDWATLSVTNPANRLSQTVGVVSGQAGAGVQFTVRVTRENQRGVYLFLDLGIGGVLRPGAAFTSVAPPPPVGPQADPIGQRGGVNLGTLPLSGITWRGIAGIRF